MGKKRKLTELANSLKELYTLERAKRKAIAAESEETLHRNAELRLECQDLKKTIHQLEDGIASFKQMNGVPGPSTSTESGVFSLGDPGLTAKNLVETFGIARAINKVESIIAGLNQTIGATPSDKPVHQYLGDLGFWLNEVLPSIQAAQVGDDPQITRPELDTFRIASRYKCLDAYLCYDQDERLCWVDRTNKSKIGDIVKLRFKDLQLNQVFINGIEVEEA